MRSTISSLPMRLLTLDSTGTNSRRGVPARAYGTEMGVGSLTVVADRGYVKSEEILACHEAGITACVPKSVTPRVLLLMVVSARTTLSTTRRRTNMPARRVNALLLMKSLLCIALLVTGAILGRWSDPWLKRKSPRGIPRRVRRFARVFLTRADSSAVN
jgi:hypothetical protein